MRTQRANNRLLQRFLLFPFYLGFAEVFLLLILPSFIFVPFVGADLVQNIKLVALNSDLFIGVSVIFLLLLKILPNHLGYVRAV